MAEERQSTMVPGPSDVSRQDVSRRAFLSLSTAAVAGTTAFAAATQAAGQAAVVAPAGDAARKGPDRPLRVAALNSIFRFRSHAYHIVGRLVHGYPVDGFHHQPNVQVVRMFNDQY